MNARALLEHSGEAAGVNRKPIVNCPFSWDFRVARKPKYKYLEPGIAERFLNEGSVRIGTLFDFRKLEHGLWRGDAGEGTLLGRGTLSFDLREGTEVPAGLGHVLAPVRGSNACMRFVDCRFDIARSSPDYYIFCVSNRRWPDGRVRDKACIEIFDFPEFVGHISMALESQVKANTFPLCFVSVQYRERTSDLAGAERDQELAPIVKPSRYAWQNEARLLWQPRKTPIEPVVLSCGSLHDFCRLVR
jgi:hypothetical protein